MLVELNVDVTYSVGGTFEIPDELAELAEQLEFGEIDCQSPLFEWLSDHIREENAMYWKYDITCFNEADKE